MLLDTSGHHQSIVELNDLESGRPLTLVCLGLFLRVKYRVTSKPAGCEYVCPRWLGSDALDLLTTIHEPWAHSTHENLRLTLTYLHLEAFGS